MFLGIDGNRFIANGSPVLLRGFGLGCHLNLEHFMLGIPGTNTEIRDAFDRIYGADAARRFWETYYRCYVDDADLRFLKSLGINCLRIPINAREFADGDAFESTAAARELDRVVGLCRSRELYAIIDMHAASAPQNPDWHSDNSTGDCGFFRDPIARSRTAALWKRVAFRYKDEPWVGGYDLLNEPCYFDPSLDETLVDFYADSIEGIRSVDDRHLVFVEGNTYARDFTMFDRNLDDRLAYAFHYYPFLQLPGRLQAPGLRDRLGASLHQDVTLDHLQEKLGRPIWCGETGHPLHGESSIGALDLFLEILEEMQISWSLWPHKDARAMGLCYPAQNGSYLPLVTAASSSWCFWDVFNQDSILASQSADDRYALYRALAKNSTEAHRRFEASLQRISLETILDALNDFRLDRCELNEPLVGCLKRRRR